MLCDNDLLQITHDVLNIRAHDVTMQPAVGGIAHAYLPVQTAGAKLP